MNVALIGCGFVADYYVRTLENHPSLKILGVMDRDSARTEHFSQFHKLPKYPSLEAVLADERVQIVINLTNPRSHYEVSKAALLAGKHVYSEKPLGMTFEEAKELVELAESKQLEISGAPCSLLGETAQTIWKALREQAVGQVSVVYAEMDDGFVPAMAYQTWLSESGIPWPYKDEFEVGCTLEHAGYYLTWLPAFFGSAVSVTAFADCTIPNKGVDHLDPPNTPDFSVACIKFASGVVARLTCSIVASHDHELRIFGDQGVMYTEDCWFYRSPVYIKRRLRIRRKTIEGPLAQRYPLVGPVTKRQKYRGAQQMDFARGIADLAEAIENKRSPRLSGRYSLHVNEMVLAIHYATAQGCTYQMQTDCPVVEPLPWAL
jgi:predicted dehydrogenase